MVNTVPHLNQHLTGFHEAKHTHSLEEARYWGLSSSLERLEGRIAREEYYSVDNWEAQRTEEVAERYHVQKEEVDHLHAWREECERARSESRHDYQYFLDSLSSYYGEIAIAVVMGTGEG